MHRLTATLLTASAACGLAVLPGTAAVADDSGSVPAWTLNAIDTDGDELLSPTEFTRAWVSHGGSPHHASQVFLRSDLDRNGYLCAKEFPRIPDPDAS
jgi:hypothetical protein